MRISDWSSDVCSSDLTLTLISRCPSSATGTLHRPSRCSLMTKRVSRALNLGCSVCLSWGSVFQSCGRGGCPVPVTACSIRARSEGHTSELQSLMRISYAVFCLKKKKHTNKKTEQTVHTVRKLNENNTN